MSISFSADGTTLYASDNDGIWQFKTVSSLAGSSTGSLIGLNDLRSLGVPYEGQDSAVAVIDTGVDDFNGAFRGRVAPGRDVFTNGFGNDDFFSQTQDDAGGNGTNGLTSADGHGTPLAGVIAQFVPQATILPVNIFAPFTAVTSATNGTSNVLTTNEAVYKGLKYVADNPFVNDPVRPNKTDRVIAAAMGFGTLETFDSEGSAFRKHKQVVIAFKNQLHRFRKLGITPVAAAGQFGAPAEAGATPGRTRQEQRRESEHRRPQRHLHARDPQRGRLGDGFDPVPLQLGRRRACRPIPGSGSTRVPSARRSSSSRSSTSAATIRPSRIW